VNWAYEQKDALVKAGCSTLAISPDGQFVMEDLVTTRKTNDLGAAVTDLRFTEILSNLQTKIYSMDQVFSASPFINGVVVDDNSTVDLDYAIRPKFCAGTLKKLVDDLWVPRGLTKNRDAVVGSIVAEINSGNGGRIDLSIQDDLVAGLKIIAAAYNWGIGAGV
jgi:phage tail sheath gpL-like